VVVLDRMGGIEIENPIHRWHIRKDGVSAPPGSTVFWSSR
jgi:hypothetical protein